MSVICTLSSAERAVLRLLRLHAEAEPIPLDVMAAVEAGTAMHPAVGDRRFYARLGDGTALVYAIEDYPEGRFRHLAVCRVTPGELPPIDRILETGAELGIELGSQAYAVRTTTEAPIGDPIHFYFPEG